MSFRIAHDNIPLMIFDQAAKSLHVEIVDYPAQVIHIGASRPEVLNLLLKDGYELRSHRVRQENVIRGNTDLASIKEFAYYNLPCSNFEICSLIDDCRTFPAEFEDAWDKILTGCLGN